MNLSPTTLPAGKGKGSEAMVMRACPARQNILQNQYDLSKKHRPEGFARLPGGPWWFELISRFLSFPTIFIRGKENQLQNSVSLLHAYGKSLQNILISNIHKLSR